MTPQRIVETFTGRWSIETTFQKMRAYLGLGTTRGQSENTVLRAAPCLLTTGFRSPAATATRGCILAQFRREQSPQPERSRIPFPLDAGCSPNRVE